MDELGMCNYRKGGRCIIYDQRPSQCRGYPASDETTRYACGYSVELVELIPQEINDGNNT